MKSGRLSPTAAPFHPTYEPANLLIFNDGIPSLTFSSEGGRSEALHGIDDQAIDEGFPPSAEDAYEMEAAEHYCAMLADLYLLEVREERARSFSYSPARWEARRKLGLKGRPHPAMNAIMSVDRRGGGRKQPVASRNLVIRSGTSQRHQLQQRRGMQGHISRSHRTRHSARPFLATIQQPRKQS